MNQKPVTYKLVLNNTGLLLGIELWQGDQHITISMEAATPWKNGYRWSEIKEFLDGVELPRYEDASMGRFINIINEQRLTSLKEKE